MAGRIRTLKPELLEDERVAALSSDAFRLFVGAILLADDHGNLRIAAGMLAGQIFWRLAERGQITIPEVERALGELLAADPADPKTGKVRPGLLTPYRVRGQTYAHVTGWERHQKVDRPGSPRVPAHMDPDAEEISCDYVRVEKNRETLARPSRLISDLRSPITDPDLQDPGSAGSEPQGSGSSTLETGSQTEPAPPSQTGPMPQTGSPPPLLQTGSASSRPPTTVPPSPVAPPALPLQPALPLPGAEPQTPEGKARDVFDAYLVGWRKTAKGNRPPRLDTKRRGLVLARLRDFPLEDLVAAAGGIWLSAWHVANKQVGFELAIRDATHIERFRDLALAEAQTPAVVAQGPKLIPRPAGAVGYAPRRFVPPPVAIPMPTTAAGMMAAWNNLPETPGAPGLASTTAAGSVELFAASGGRT